MGEGVRGGGVRGSDSPSDRVVPESAELESLKKRAFNKKKKETWMCEFWLWLNDSPTHFWCRNFSHLPVKLSAESIY